MTDFDTERRRGNFHGVLNLCLNDLPINCLDAHAIEENDKDGDDGNGDDSSCGGVVLGLAVVSEYFGGGEEINKPDSFVDM